jgi:hypothetical protein
VTGEEVSFSVIAPGDPEGLLMTDRDKSNEQGLVQATFVAGEQQLPLPLQLQATLAGEPTTRAAFTLTVDTPVEALHPYPLGRTTFEAPTLGTISLGVRAGQAKADDGARLVRPSAGREIQWKVLEDSSRQAIMLSQRTFTDERGLSWGELRAGREAAKVTVEASTAGAPAVQFTIHLIPWGNCDDQRPCPVGWQCVQSACVQPEPVCVDDADCLEDERCRYGQCVAVMVQGAPCYSDGDCRAEETCVAGLCSDCELRNCPCTNLEDCPEGFVCNEGACRCRGPGCGDAPEVPCTTEPPPVQGAWTLYTTYRFREALPALLDEGFRLMGPVARYLSEGLFDGFSFDIPIIGHSLAEAANAISAALIPRWVGELLATFADFDEILSTVRVIQDMTLWPSPTPHQYTGEMSIREVEMTWHGEVHRGRFEELTSYRVDAEPIVADAICETFFVRRHHVGFAMGKVVRWALDVVTTGVSEGEHFSLEESLVELGETCHDVAEVTDGLARDMIGGAGLPTPNVYQIVRSACEAGFYPTVGALIAWLDGLYLRLELTEAEGYAAITDDRRLDQGHWEGTLVHEDFSGDFIARKN